MKENKKKILLITIGIVGLISLVIGISYAYWKFSKKQNSNNSISTLSCLNLELTDVSDAISLTNASPITDEDAKSLKPYEFKITNTCENNTSYAINLEVMEVENRLNSNYVAAMLDNGEKEILGSKIQVAKNYTGNDYTSVEAYNLGTGYIAGGEEKTHRLKLWMDESASDKSDAMSKKFISKIVITGEEMNEPTLAITVNGKSVDQIPQKNDYKVTVDCGSTATGEWNSDNWNLQLNSINSSNISCSIDFKEPNAADYITNLATTSEEIVDDETEDHNLRYIGSDPNNYVQFNGELWRIIGVMNDVEDETGTIESRVKLRRSWNLGPAYSWDYKSDGSYAGDWTTSTLMKLLNEGAYYNRTSGIYYNYVEGQDPTPTNLYLSGDGLTVEAKSMISKVKWKLGGRSTYDNVTTSMFYTSEKGTEVYNGRSTEWIGEVGLIYPSDYGYATSGGSTVNRASCLENLWKWNDSEHSDCRRNNWMYRSVTGQWTMTSHTLNSSWVFSMSTTGEIHSDFVYFASNEFYPVVYLSTDAKIKSGTGTYNDPYIIGL